MDESSDLTLWSNIYFKEEEKEEKRSKEFGTLPCFQSNLDKKSILNPPFVAFMALS